MRDIKTGSPVKPKTFGYTVEESEYFENPRLPLYIMQTNNQGQADHPVHKHDFTEITIVTGGSADHLTDFGRYELHSGDVFIIYKGMKHGYSRQKDFSLINILCNEKRLPMPLWDFGQTNFADLLFNPRKNSSTIMHLAPAEVDQVKKLADKITHEYEKKKSAFRFQVMAFFMQLLVYLERCCPAGAKNPDGELSPMPKVLDFFETHYNHDFDLNRLIRSAGMSRRNFFRKFKKSTGYAPMQYLLQVRLRHAVNMLIHSRNSLDEIAVNCGFSGRQTLNYHFFKIYRMTPLQFRELKRPDPHRTN